jgi:hypothetical protein
LPASGFLIYTLMMMNGKCGFFWLASGQGRGGILRMEWLDETFCILDTHNYN